MNLDSRSNIACMLTQFIDNCSLLRCDKLFPDNPFLYLGLYQPFIEPTKLIDYDIVSTDKIVTCSFSVLDPDVKFSYHLSMIATVLCANDKCSGNQITSSASTHYTAPSSEA